MGRLGVAPSAGAEVHEIGTFWAGGLASTFGSMSEQQNPSSEALFRYLIVSEVLGHMLAGEGRGQAVRALAAREQRGFDGVPRQVSERSIYRWLAAYSSGGQAALERKSRCTRPSTSLSEQLVAFLVDEKRVDSRASVPELIRRARKRGIVKPGQALSRSTVYRTCKRLGLSMARRKGAKERDSRRFAYAHRMDMVLCDGKHFRVGAKRAKRVALFFIDDATRYILHTVVGTSESKELFLRGLFELIAKHGLFSACYVDHGPGFVAQDTVAVFSALGIPLLHGEVGYKEGRGKVERFNRTAKADILRGLDGRADIDPGLSALELRLRHYTDKEYAHRPHESLAGKTPWQRFDGDQKRLRFPESEESLRAKFEVWIERRVSKDHVVSLDSILYEVPRGYAGQRILLRRRLLEGRIGLLHEGRLIDLFPVDLQSNARAPRSREMPHEPARQMPPITAAELAFQQDFGPVVAGDGGFEGPGSDSDSDHDSDSDSDNPLQEDTPW